MNDRPHHRLRDFDYKSPGAYFLTLCSFDKRCTFGEIRAPKSCLSEQAAIALSPIGKAIQRTLDALPDRFPGLTIDASAIMPNHVHMLLMLGEGAEDGVLQVIGAFKSLVAKDVREKGDYRTEPLWQKGFYDHVVRNETDLERIREYIDKNPAKWLDDRFYQ